jgi:hypothetical protein
VFYKFYPIFGGHLKNNCNYLYGIYARVKMAFFSEPDVPDHYETPG